MAEQGARRIGFLAILTAVTVVGAAILQQALQPEMAAAQQNPLFRLSALFLVLAGVGLAALQRAELVSPQDLLDLGLVFEVAGSCALALMENAAPWPNSPIRGSATVSNLDRHLCRPHSEQALEKHHGSDHLCGDRSVCAPRRRTDSRLSGVAVEPISQLFAGSFLRCRMDALHQHASCTNYTRI